MHANNYGRWHLNWFLDVGLFCQVWIEDKKIILDHEQIFGFQVLLRVKQSFGFQALYHLCKLLLFSDSCLSKMTLRRAHCFRMDFFFLIIWANMTITMNKWEMPQWDTVGAKQYIHDLLGIHVKLQWRCLFFTASLSHQGLEVLACWDRSGFCYLSAEPLSIQAAKERLKQVITHAGDRDASNLCSDPPEIQSLIESKL